MNAHSQIHIPVISILVKESLTAYEFSDNEVKRTKQYAAGEKLTVIGFEVITYTTSPETTLWLILEENDGIRYGVSMRTLRRPIEMGEIEVDVNGEEIHEYSGLEQAVTHR